ncbi:unnamed protein product [Citrullus colocynthis]|uniref:Uncharacterized protein n=1 Tax=Citrullus colocynthis TaxID=252529 RepID=A0ABP0YQU7_9ROSI
MHDVDIDSLVVHQGARSSKFVDTSAGTLASPSTNKDSALHLNELIGKKINHLFKTGNLPIKLLITSSIPKVENVSGEATFPEVPESTNASDSIEPFGSTTLEEINHEYNVVVPLEEVGEMVGDVSLDDKHTSDEVAQEDIVFCSTAMLMHRAFYRSIAKL